MNVFRLERKKIRLLLTAKLHGALRKQPSGFHDRSSVIGHTCLQLFVGAFDRAKKKLDKKFAYQLNSLIHLQCKQEL
jgi:hypothetical protein